jgi:hypothetical protein
MQLLDQNTYQQIFGGLTDSEFDRLAGKAAGDIAKASFLGLMAAADFISVKTFVITAIGAPIATIAGTYLLYENKDYLTGKYHELEFF